MTASSEPKIKAQKISLVKVQETTATIARP